jgi:acetyltransferase-like isoleucine patch superfamily enzyme
MAGRFDMLKRLIFNIVFFCRKLIPSLANKILMRLDKILFLSKLGMKIGNSCRIQTSFLPTEAFLIELGNHVHLGDNVQLITHDGGVWVLRELTATPELDCFGTIKIGNNVFIGNNAIILPNVQIGDNVVVGAGAVVSKSIEPNSIAVGAPAKKIGDIDSYMHRKLPTCLKTKGMKESEKRNMILSQLKDSL